MEPKHFNLPHVMYWHRLKNAVETGLDEFDYRNDHTTDIWESEHGTLSLQWGQYIFIMDILDGMYVGNDVSSDLMYYHHSELLVPGTGNVENDPEYTQEVAPPNADWYNIRVLDAILDRAKAFAHIDMITDHIDKNVVKAYQLPMDGVIRYANNTCVKTIEKLFSEAFTTIVGIDPEADKDNYSIKAYPSYTDETTVIIHVILGEFDDKGYINKDNAEFFLSIDLTSNTSKITPDLPWIMPEDFNSELFTLMPRDYKTDRTLLSAIQIAVDDMYIRIHDQYPEANQLYGPIWMLGMATDASIVKSFEKSFKTMIDQLAGGRYRELTHENYRIRTFANGITRILLGYIIIDVAIDGLGLADIGTFKMFSNKDIWDDIIWEPSLPVTNIPEEPELSDIDGVTVISDVIHGQLNHEVNETEILPTAIILNTLCDVVQQSLKKMTRR